MEFTRKELYMLLNSPRPLWLVGADLTGANLTRADLSGANLSGANLKRANLKAAVMPDGKKIQPLTRLEKSTG